MLLFKSQFFLVTNLLARSQQSIISMISSWKQRALVQLIISIINYIFPTKMIFMSKETLIEHWCEHQKKKRNSPLRFSGIATNLRHTAFNWKQWCCSAKANVVATVLMATSSQSLASQSIRSLSSPYLSAAASRCWDINVEAHFELRPVRSCMSGRESQYIKWSSACKVRNRGKRLYCISNQYSVAQTYK